MEQSLALNKICFGQPFFSKSLGLFTFANRAVSLLTVKPIVWVSKFTGSLSLIYSTDRLAIFHSIFKFCNRFKMGRLNTISISTNVIYNKIVWYSSILEVVCNSMRPSILFSKVKRSISILVEMAVPEFAFSNLFPKTIKSILFLFGIVFHIGHYTPCIKSVKYV